MQVLEIITDACLVEPNIGVGAAICRIKLLNHEINSSKMTQILRGYWVFKASQSFEAEIITGILCIKECLSIIDSGISMDICKNKNLSQSQLKIKYLCDLPYLQDLLDDENMGSNIVLKDLVKILANLTSIYDFKINYPKTSSEKKYHQYCHRICSEVRSSIINKDFDQNTLRDLLKKTMDKHSNWKFLESSSLIDY